MLLLRPANEVTDSQLFVVEYCRLVSSDKNRLIVYDSVAGVCALDTETGRRSLPTDDDFTCLLRRATVREPQARREACEMYRASYPNDFGIVDSARTAIFVEPGPPVPRRGRAQYCPLIYDVGLTLVPITTVRAGAFDGGL
jgi:hypothetical protein